MRRGTQLRGGKTSDAGAIAIAPTAGWRGVTIIFLIIWLLLLWPLVINRAPFYSDDSASYFRGGAFGFNSGLLILDHWWQSLFGMTAADAGGDPQTIVAAAVAESGGTRSVIYSIATYLLRAPGNSLVALAIAQAGAVALVITCLGRLVAPKSGLWSSVAAGAGVAFLTSAAWYAAYVVPDVLAGVAIAGAVALTVFFDRTNLAMRMTLLLLVAFCISVHGSHLLVALSTLVAGAAANFWLRRASLAAGLRRILWFSSPVILAVAALLGTSYMAFGEASLAPKRYPIQLARAVADGPGAWHLRDHCATERYAICEVFGPNPPRNVGDFLWARNGVRYRASPEQMDRIRAEEGTIVWRAALEYPVHQIRRSFTNMFLQLFEFGPGDLSFGVRLVGDEDPWLAEIRPDRPVLKAVGKALIYLSFFASILLLLAVRRRLRSIEIAAISVAAIGLLANAAVCGILSGVTDRYQGRVAWVLPALVLMILLRLWTENRASVAETATARL